MAESLASAAEVWLAVKDHVTDEQQAAMDVVNALIDNLGVDGESIKASDLGQDKDIKHALTAYVLDEVEEDDGLDTWGDEQDDSDDQDEDDY